MISIGSSLAPLVVPILNGSDDTWKYFILSSVVSYSPDLAQALVSELERIAFFPTPSEKKEEVAGVAKEILRSRQKQSNDFEVKMVQPDSF